MGKLRREGRMRPPEYIMRPVGTYMLRSYVDIKLIVNTYLWNLLFKLETVSVLVKCNVHVQYSVNMN